MKISVLDHTLGHRPEPCDVVFGIDDRLAITRRLDRLGIDLIEAGSPAGDRSARAFFDRARNECHLTHAQLVASARIDAIRETLARDTGVQAVVDALTPVVALDGCCWHAGPVGLQEYCRRITEAVIFFKAKGRVVIFRAEDFFDGYCTDPSFALRMLEAAKSGGADVICLADSAAGTLPNTVREVCLEVRKRFDGVLGIRAHDSHELAGANTLEAVEQGFTHVEGSVGVALNRGPSANLCSIVSNLEYKLGHTVIGPDNLAGMPGVARFIAEAGAPPLFVEPEADAEKLLRSIDSRLRGRLNSRERHAVLDRVRLLDSMGYQLGDARGTLELAVREALSPDQRPFEAERYEVVSHSAMYSMPVSSATATVRIGDAIRTESEEGSGPVEALERSLRQCLFVMYPGIAKVRVKNYRVDTLSQARSGSRARVAVDWSESGERWTTAGVSEDLLEAAWLALVDGFRLQLLRLGQHGAAALPSTGDSSWAV